MRLKGGIFLEKELSSSYFMILVGILALIFFIYQLTIFMINKNKIDYTDGSIVGANTAVPETMKKNNSKWAIVSYKVDGKMITSENKIQVSMNSKVGDKVKIAYLINNPEKLFTATFKKAFISFIIALISFIVAHYIK